MAIVYQAETHQGHRRNDENLKALSKMYRDIITDSVEMGQAEGTFQRNLEGDEQGCRFENGKVIVPKSFKRVYDLFTAGEWLAMTEDPAYGGQGMPRTVSMAAGDYFTGANYSFMMYPGLTYGAALLVEHFGTEKQNSLLQNSKLISLKYHIQESVFFVTHFIVPSPAKK